MKWPTWLPRPSFWSGTASVLDLFGTQRLGPEALRPWTEGGLAPTDAEALAADWLTIDGDFQTVMGEDNASFFTEK